MKFVKNTKYYTGTVYEFNLPTGHTCPHALECVVKVNRETGKFTNESHAFRCYAASAERFPGVRNSRWTNFDDVQSATEIELPKNCKAVRIHAAGDFFSQEYFDLWMDTARKNPDVEFWAYTKSLPYWVNRINDIPQNMTLTASRGGKHDHLIEEYNLKNTIVLYRHEVKFIENKDGFDYVEYNGVSYPVDYNDDVARIKDITFVLLNNHEKDKELK